MENWGRGDLNPHALRHMILNHARLPIPTLPHLQAEYPNVLYHFTDFVSSHTLIIWEEGNKRGEAPSVFGYWENLKNSAKIAASYHHD